MFGNVTDNFSIISFKRAEVVTIFDEKDRTILVRSSVVDPVVVLFFDLNIKKFSCNRGHV